MASKRIAGTTEAINRLRAMIAPEVYKEQLHAARAQLIQRATQILVDRELTEGDPALDTPERLEEKLALLANIDEALVSIEWRINDIDEAIAAFDVGKDAAMNRQQRRRLAKLAPKESQQLQDSNEDGAAGTEDGAKVLEA